MRLLRMIAMAAVLSAPALAADSETYSVDGAGPDGSKYSGSVTLTELHPTGKVDGDVFTVEWTIGSEVTKGVGVLSDDRKTLSVTYPSGDTVGLSTMIQTDTGATGIWFIKGMTGFGTEVWTKSKTEAATTEPVPPPPAGAATYDHAVECAAATSYVVGMLRSTPGSDAAKIDAYDKANSAWIMKLSDFPEGKDLNKNIDAIQAKQQVYANDPDGMAKATPVADDCVATAPAME